MSKSTIELLMGAEAQEGVRNAVRDAVARADAAGLVPAFQPYIALAKVLPRSVVLAIRRQELAKQAAQAHLDTDRPIYYCEDAYPDEMVRQWPDGNRELVTLALDGTVLRAKPYPAN
jgi:hypothetical protein